MENTTARVIAFQKPFSFEDKEYTELRLELAALTGRDLLEASREVRAIGETSPVVELSKSYYAVVGAKAAGVPVDLVLALPAREFSQLTVEVQSFLFE